MSLPNKQVLILLLFIFKALQSQWDGILSLLIKANYTFPKLNSLQALSIDQQSCHFLMVRCFSSVF